MRRHCFSFEKGRRGLHSAPLSQQHGVFFFGVALPLPVILRETLDYFLFKAGASRSVEWRIVPRQKLPFFSDVFLRQCCL